MDVGTECGDRVRDVGRELILSAPHDGAAKDLSLSKLRREEEFIGRHFAFEM